MAWVMAAAQFAGYGMTAMGQREEGAANLREGLIAANTLEMNAKQERAYSQRKAIEERREARLVSSRAKAIAGGNSQDPSVQKALVDIETEGELRALNRLYEGDEQARGMNSQAAAARRGGADAFKGAYTRASGTILEGASSMYDKYGGKKKKGWSGAGYGTTKSSGNYTTTYGQITGYDRPSVGR